MAHADYNCCAICDSKMEYCGYDASTKERLCDCCIHAFHGATGKLATTADEVKAHLMTVIDDAEALAFLHAIGFDPCFYNNDLDSYLIERGLIKIDCGAGSKWGKRLKPLTK